MIKETVGKVATDLMQKTPDSRDPIELAREMQKEYMKNLMETVNTGKGKWDTDFFVIVITKNEKLLHNVFRNYFFPRLTCPTPDYDQSVFWYKKADEELHYVWTIPSRDASFHLKDNALVVDPSEKLLLNFVLQFEDGTLYKLSKKLNKEEELITGVILK